MVAPSQRIPPPRRTSPPRNKPDGFEPQYVAWEPRFEAQVAGVFLAIIGIEVRGVDTLEARARLLKSFGDAKGPEILETGTPRPGYGAAGQIWFAYWRTRDAYRAWAAEPSVRALWEDDQLLEGDVGIWREECWISLDHNETSFSRNADITGLGLLSDGVAETEVHGYWGSARDRINAAVTSELEAEASRAGGTGSSLGRRVHVQGSDNICLIRTSQDLTLANAQQLAVYHDEVAPTLFAGLDFLRDGGRNEGCIGMRLIDEVETDGSSCGRTCGVGFFRSLAHLERWTHHHPTHGAIMASFIGMVQRFEGQPGLHLWHEITVFPSGHLAAEYVNCVGDGGLLGLS